MRDHPVDLSMIQAAARRIEGKIRETPMLDPAPNDGGGGLETISDIPQTGVIEKLHCVYGNNP